jgi:PAS domain S-box-containing protein
LRATLHVNAGTPRAWSEADVALAEDVAGRTWAAVERARAEAALREGEARFRNMADHAPVMMWVTDASGACTYLNRAWYDFTGQTAAEAEGFGWLEATHPEDKGRAERVFRDANARAEPFRLDYRLRRADGTFRWAIDAASPRFGPDGAFLGYVGSVLDIDERREVEGALRESEARLRLALQAGQLAEVTFHLDEGGVSHSPAFAELFGHPPDKRLTLAEIRAQYHPEDHDRVVNERAAILAGDQSFYEIEKRIVRPDGGVRWLYGRGSVERDAQGRAVSVTAVYLDDTERKRTEVALRESEQRLRAIVETATDYAIFTTDAEGRIETWPAGAQAVFGWSAEEAVGQPDALIFTPEDRAEGVPERERQVAQDAGQSPNVRGHLRRDGSRVFIEGMARPLRGENGTVTGFVKVGQDVTERQRADEALRASEARLRELNDTLEQRIAVALAERKLLADLVEGTDAFVQVADPDFRWLAINKAAADEFVRIYGVRPRAGDSMLDLLADRPEHQAAVRAVWARALGGEEFTEVGEFGDPGRERRHYEMKFNVLRDAQGRQIGAYQFVHDVTERIGQQERLRQAEAARREADALYRAFFENAPEALFVIGVEADGGFVVEEVNPAHEAGVGFRIDDIRGKRIDDILPPEVAKPVLENYRRVVTGGAVHQWREVYDMGGEPRHWDTSLVPVRDETGQIVRLIGSSRDVTRQVAAEEALRQSQKMEAMGQLTGGVAHDFNNLLTPIIGSLDRLVSRGVGSPRERQLMAGALESAERAKTLVQRLLAFARRQPIQPTAVDLTTLVGGMAGLIGSTLGPTVEVRLDLAEDLPPARADANQLEMALLNLAVNARDAMPEGGRLTVAAERVSVRGQLAAARGLRPGHYVRLSVSDTGSGMDAATRVRAVEPFFSTKGIGRGTGLGLSMVHGLAAQLGGGLSIDSEPGRGTTVALWLPLSAEPVDDVEAERPAPLPAASRGRALLVDDEELVRQSTADMLGEMGFEVLEAGSAEEALQAVRAGAPLDLLVTDHLMPGMSGAELARQARALRPDLPVLIVSGYAELEGIAPDLPRLVKPFRVAELAERMSTLMPAAAPAG